ncbi:hypothetical protein PT2222_10083 [Paraburkholderia tropica]
MCTMRARGAAGVGAELNTATEAMTGPDEPLSPRPNGVPLLHQLPLAQDGGDLLRILVAQRGRFRVVRAHGGPGIAVLVHLLAQMPGRDVDVLARLHQRALRNAVLRERRQMDRVDLHDAVIDRSVRIPVQCFGCVVRFLPRDRAQDQRIHLLVARRLVETIGARARAGAGQRERKSGDRSGRNLFHSDAERGPETAC